MSALSKLREPAEHRRVNGICHAKRGRLLDLDVLDLGGIEVSLYLLPYAGSTRHPSLSKTSRRPVSAIGRY